MSIRNQFRDVIARATFQSDQMIGVDFRYQPKDPNLAPITLRGMPYATDGSIVEHFKVQTEDTTLIMAISRQTVSIPPITMEGYPATLWVPGTVYRFQEGDFLVWEDFNWTVQRVSDPTSLKARWELHCTRSHAVRMT